MREQPWLTKKGRTIRSYDSYTLLQVLEVFFVVISGIIIRPKAVRASQDRTNTPDDLYAFAKMRALAPLLGSEGKFAGSECELRWKAVALQKLHL